MNNNKILEQSIESYIRDVILKYCPYLDNRIHILGNTNTPEIEIKINIKTIESIISFLYGNSTFKKSIPEKAIISYNIRYKELFAIIDYILTDHEIIEYIDINANEISMLFDINWTEKKLSGINCNNINLILSFETKKLLIEYAKRLLSKYKSYLKNTPYYENINNTLIEEIKYLSKEEPNNDTPFNHSISEEKTPNKSLSLKTNQ